MPYRDMFVLSPVSEYQSEDYKAYGMKVEKKCKSEQVWEGLEPGDRIKLFFDDKGRVIEWVRDEESGNGGLTEFFSKGEGDPGVSGIGPWTVPGDGLWTARVQQGAAVLGYLRLL